MAKQRITEAQAAAALFPSLAPAKDNRQAWKERQQQMVGLVKKATADRGCCSPLGGQAVRSAQAKAKR
jgi:hypothetical protein